MHLLCSQCNKELVQSKTDFSSTEHKRPQNQEIREQTEQTAEERDMAFTIEDQYSIHLSDEGGGLGLGKSLFQPCFNPI